MQEFYNNMFAKVVIEICTITALTISKETANVSVNSLITKTINK